MKLGAKSGVKVSPTQQIAAFTAKFDPKMAKLITSLRKALRKRLPTAIELVYDNYNFLVFGFCTTDRASDCLVSLAAQAKGVSLCFYWGKTLPDPHKVLLGSGNQVRWIRLEGPATLARPEVEALLQAAVAEAKHPLPEVKGYTIVKSISAKQRPRRAPAK
jgi:hypothetical protein